MLQKYLSDCENFDETESIFSETTVASDVAEQRVAFYNQAIRENSTDNEKLQFLNLKYSVNVYGDKEGKNESEAEHLNAISEVVKKAVTLGEIEKKKRKKKFVCKRLKKNLFYVGFAALIVVGILAALYLAKNKSSGEKENIWIKSGVFNDKNLPLNCIVGGSEIIDNYDGPLLIGRKAIGEELVVGKVIDAWKAGFFPLHGKEYRYDEYEVLCTNNYNWISKDGDLANAIHGGLAVNNVTLFVCKAKHEQSVIPGKLYLPLGCCYIGYYGNEYCKKDYSVLIKT